MDSEENFSNIFCETLKTPAYKKLLKSNESLKFWSGFVSYTNEKRFIEYIDSS